MLAACPPPDHEVRYSEVPFGRDEPAELYDCDLVAMTELTTQAQNAYVLAERLRRQGERLALGGLHPTVMPKEAAEHADLVFVGEGSVSGQSL
ncbi:MAG: cobalamin-dependent protein [Gemmatales bacterium]|nr:cobalamin-dependent protein [Gemmatales bacterium]MDW7995649.1 cobalamin-dependent protein [Gemmatales bacterium]